MMPVLLDTSFLLALVLKDDELHERALAWQQFASGPFVTTEYILVELVDALSAETLRGLAVATVALLRKQPAVRVIPAGTELFDEGLAWFADRRDKRWSLTDCISFAVMRREGMTEALSADHHFEQAGFAALLRRDPPAG
jgi:hypothetical protein